MFTFMLSSFCCDGCAVFLVFGLVRFFKQRRGVGDREVDLICFDLNLIWID